MLSQQQVPKLWLYIAQIWKERVKHITWYFVGGNRFHLLWHYYLKPPILYWVPTMFQALWILFFLHDSLQLPHNNPAPLLYYHYSPNEEAEVCGDEAVCLNLSRARQCPSQELSKVFSACMFDALSLRCSFWRAYGSYSNQMRSLSPHRDMVNALSPLARSGVGWKSHM